MTQQEINKIHSEKRGVLNKIYTTLEGQKYIGLSNGRLRLLTNSEEVLHNNNNVSSELNKNNNSINDIILELQSPTLNKYKKFYYDASGNITKKEIYENSTMLNLLYTTIFNYSGSDLVSMNITRHSDNFTFTKTLSYDSNLNLDSLNTI